MHVFYIVLCCMFGRRDEWIENESWGSYRILMVLWFALDVEVNRPCEASELCDINTMKG